MTGNNFALELTVGIYDLFTQEQQRIERGAKTLEKQFERLQKTAGDVTEFRRMKEGLEQIGKESGTTSREFQEQERQIQKYAESLRKAEVNVSKLTQEQRRLNEQLREAKQAAEGVRSLSADMADLAGTIAGVAVVSGTVMRGNAAISAEKQQELQTGRGPGYFSSAAEREWLSRVMATTGATPDLVREARKLTSKGVDVETGRDMAEQVLKLKRTMPESDTPEIARGVRQFMKAFGTDAQTSADLIYRVYTEVGDDYGDLFDSITEYSPLLKDVGISGEQLSAAFIAAIKNGARNFDIAADVLKESLKASLPDPARMKTLLGEGKKKGVIDELIKDEGTRNKLKSALGEYREASATGGDLVGPWSKMIATTAELYKADPMQAYSVLEQIVGVKGAEDIGIEGLLAISRGLINPQAFVGEYQGKLAEGVKDSFSSMERLSTSWDVTVDKFAKAVGDFTENMSPFTDLLAKGVEEAGNLIEENPNTAVAGSAALLIGAIAGKSLIFNKLKGWFKGGMGGAGSIADGVPDWMMSRDGLPSPAKAGGWQQLVKGFGGAKGLGLLGALFGGVQMYEAAQSGDNAQLAVTTGGVGGGILGGYSGAALGTMIFPGLGTAVGGVAGGILGSILGEEGMQALVNWFDGGKADQEIARLLPPSSIAKPTEPGTSSAPPPAIALSQQLAITISPDFTNAADIEAAIVRAMRNSTPELMQEFQATLERVMQGMDYAQGSS